MGKNLVSDEWIAWIVALIFVVAIFTFIVIIPLIERMV